MSENKERIAINSTLVALFSVSLIQSGINAINPVLPMIIEAFPAFSATTVRLVSTIPSLTSMLVGLCLGITVGKKVKYRTAFLIGAVLYVIGGTGPAFFHNSLPLILFFRAIFGCASGCFTITNAFILSTQQVVKQASIIGLAAMIQNIGAAIMQMASGTLADIHWPIAFLPYFIGIVTIVMVLTMFKEPKIFEENATEKKSAVRFSRRVWLYIAIQCFVSITCVPVMVGMGTVVSGKNLGGNNVGTVVAMVLTVCQVGGIITGAIFGKYVAILKRFTMPVALFVQGLGIFVILIANTVFTVGLGATLSGIGTILVMSLCSTYAGQSTTKESIPFATIIIMLCSMIANFLSVYYIAFCDKILSGRFGTDVESCFAVSSVLYVFAIVITLIFNTNPKSVIQD